MTTPAYMLSYNVDAMWRPRGETREQCAGRAFKWFTFMRECDPNFAKWFRKGNTLAEALRHRVDLDASMFASLLDQGGALGHRRFHLGIWNGLDGDQCCAASFLVGSTNPEDLESLGLDVPLDGSFADRIVTVASISAILRSTVLAWDPEVGIVHTSQLIEAFSDQPPEDRIGWINYFDRSRGPIPPLPSPVRTEPVEDKGTLIILGDEKLSGANPAHVALAQQVSAELKKAGVLKPWW